MTAYAYLVRCADGTLYAGWTYDLGKRLAAHNGKGGSGAKYTRVRRPVALVYYEAFSTKEAAMSREAAYKRMTRAAKLAMIEKANAAKTMRARKAGEKSAAARGVKPVHLTQASAGQVAQPTKTVAVYAMRLSDALVDATPSVLPLFDEARRAALLKKRPKPRAHSAWAELLARYSIVQAANVVFDATAIARDADVPSVATSMAHAAGMPFDATAIMRDARGMPHFVSSALASWHVSLSHSGDWVVCAIGNVPVGVDVEYPRTRKAVAAVVKRYFAEPAKEHLASRKTDASFMRAFLRYWTVTESALKRTGAGLAGGIEKIDVAGLLAERDAIAARVFRMKDGAFVALTTDADALPARVAIARSASLVKFCRAQMARMNAHTHGRT